MPTPETVLLERLSNIEGAKSGARRELSKAEIDVAARRFEEQLKTTAASMVPPPTAVAPPATARPGEVSAPFRPGAIERPGDAILNGFLKVRANFDAQIKKVNAIQADASVTNVNDLIAAQMEIAKLGIMTDVTSKLANKFGTTLDMLQKG